MNSNDELVAVLIQAGFGNYAEAISYHPIVRHVYEEGGTEALRSYFDSMVAQHHLETVEAIWEATP